MQGMACVSALLPLGLLQPPGPSESHRLLPAKGTLKARGPADDTPAFHILRRVWLRSLSSHWTSTCSEGRAFWALTLVAPLNEMITGMVRDEQTEVIEASPMGCAQGCTASTWQGYNSDPALLPQFNLRWPSCLSLPRIFPSLGPGVLCSRNPLSPSNLGQLITWSPGLIPKKVWSQKRWQKSCEWKEHWMESSGLWSTAIQLCGFGPDTSPQVSAVSSSAKEKAGYSPSPGHSPWARYLPAWSFSFLLWNNRHENSVCLMERVWRSKKIVPIGA